MSERWGDERARSAAPAVSWALRELVQAATEVDHALARSLALRPVDHAALGHVLNAATPVGPAELAARLGISSGSATELVDRLERAGHLRRERHPDDRRRIGLHATESAVAGFRGALGPMFAGLTEVAEALSAPERDVVTRYLRAVTARLETVAADLAGTPSRTTPPPPGSTP